MPSGTSCGTRREPIATRPLAIQTAGSWFTYGLDLTKNVTELYKSDGTIANAYTYAPFGGVTQTGNITNPLQWSSEVYDAELGMVYYNFRFYNPRDGRWIARDRIGDFLYYNNYSYAWNQTQGLYDILGEHPAAFIAGILGAIYAYKKLSEIEKSATSSSHHHSQAIIGVQQHKSSEFINQHLQNRKKEYQNIGQHIYDLAENLPLTSVTLTGIDNIDLTIEIFVPENYKQPIKTISDLVRLLRHLENLLKQLKRNKKCKSERQIQQIEQQIQEIKQRINDFHRTRNI